MRKKIDQNVLEYKKDFEAIKGGLKCGNLNFMLA